jgi:hypothetical protein
VVVFSGVIVSIGIAVGVIVLIAWPMSNPQTGLPVDPPATSLSEGKEAENTSTAKFVPPPPDIDAIVVETAMPDEVAINSQSEKGN